MSSYFIYPLCDWHLQWCMNLFIRMIMNDLELYNMTRFGWMQCFSRLCAKMSWEIQVATATGKSASHTTSKSRIQSEWLTMPWLISPHGVIFPRWRGISGWWISIWFYTRVPIQFNRCRWTLCSGCRIPLAVGSSHWVPQRSGNWWRGSAYQACHHSWLQFRWLTFILIFSCHIMSSYRYYIDTIYSISFVILRQVVFQWKCCRIWGSWPMAHYSHNKANTLSPDRS